MKKNTIWSGYYKRKKRYWFTACILLSLVILLACIMMVYGNTIYMPGTVLEVLKGNETKGAAFTIKTLRLPRMLAAIFCGAAFGLAGNTFQKLLGNPLASPDIIGVTSGASVAAVFGILVLKWNGNIVSILAVLSGLLVSSAIYFFAQGDGFSNGKLILTGIGMQAFLNALISWMLLKASEYDVSSALRWLSGSLNGVSMDQVPRAYGCGGLFHCGNFSSKQTSGNLTAGGSTCQGAWHKDHSHTARSHFMCVAVDCVCNVGDRTDCLCRFSCRTDCGENLRKWKK